MEPLTWTGSLSPMNFLFALAALVLVLAVLAQIILSFVVTSEPRSINADGTLEAERGPLGLTGMVVRWSFAVLLGLALIYWALSLFMGLGAGIFGGMIQQLIPVWIALIVLFAVSITFKRKLGLYGKLFDSTVGMIGFGLVMFWVMTGLLGGPLDLLATHDSLSQVSGMKNKLPGTPLRGAEEGDYPYFLLGGDNLARDVFSRLIKGSWIVVQIAPIATLFAFMVGITLGLPAGYYSGPAVRKGTLPFLIVGGLFGILALVTLIFGGIWNFLLVAVVLGLVFVMIQRASLDTVLSFIANLILAFPVILLFYLLVTPEIILTGIPNYMATFLFAFPLIFFAVLLNSRYYTQPAVRTPLLIVVLGVLGWLYLSLISSNGSIVQTPTYAIPGLPAFLDGFDIDPGILVVFVSVVFVNAPTVFRIVRGLALDIKTRDYVAAAQTRGEGPWYIMLWEILPNARGPLIVDFCLRIGYTTILLGTLGFFGLGLESESPDWGTTINAGRRLLALYPHAAIAPAVCLLTLVLGLNLLADGLREESLKD